MEALSKAQRASTAVLPLILVAPRFITSERPRTGQPRGPAQPADQVGGGKTKIKSCLTALAGSDEALFGSAQRVPRSVEVRGNLSLSARLSTLFPPDTGD